MKLFSYSHHFAITSLSRFKLLDATNNISSIYYTSTSKKRYSEGEFLGYVISLAVLLLLAIIIGLCMCTGIGCYYRCNREPKKPGGPQLGGTHYGSADSTGGGGGHGDNGEGL